MIPQTVSIADIARTLSMSEATVRDWVRSRRWPTGQPIRGLKLSDSPAADIRIFESDVDAFAKECAKTFSRESVAVVSESAKPKVSAARRRRKALEVEATERMLRRSHA